MFLFLPLQHGPGMPQFFSPLPVSFLFIHSSCLLLSICLTAYLRPPVQWRSVGGVPVPGFTFRTFLDLLGRLPVPVTRVMGSLSVPAGLSLCSGWHMFGTSALKKLAHLRADGVCGGVSAGTLEAQNEISNINWKYSKCLGVKEQVLVNKNDHFGFYVFFFFTLPSFFYYSFLLGFLKNHLATSRPSLGCLKLKSCFLTHL